MAAESGLESVGLTADAAGNAPVAAGADAFDERFAEILAALRSEPNSFGFFQAVRLLERIMALGLEWQPHRMGID